MGDFINYQHFSNLQEASDLIDLLNANQIPFEIDDSATKFSIVKDINPLEDGIVIKIKETDVEKVDKINFKNTEIYSDDHYLYSFSDKDIMDIVINPEEWTEEEIILAKEIAKQRDLKPAELIKPIQKKENTYEKTEQTKQKAVQNPANWFLFIAVFSILNTISVIFHKNLYFKMGLGINDFIVGFMYGIQQASGTNLMIYAFILSLLVSAFLLWIWIQSKKKNRKIYLMGTIIYGIDVLMSIFSTLTTLSTNALSTTSWWWFGLASRLFILWMLCVGYKTLRSANCTNNKNQEIEQLT